MTYKKQIDPLCTSLVAIKKNQTEVHAPAHEARHTVACEDCDEQFLICTHSLVSPRITVEEAAKRLEVLLDGEHKAKEKHQNSYVLQD
jgi:hypothetical protein